MNCCLAVKGLTLRAPLDLLMKASSISAIRTLKAETTKVSARSREFDGEERGRTSFPARCRVQEHREVGTCRSTATFVKTEKTKRGKEVRKDSRFEIETRRVQGDSP